MAPKSQGESKQITRSRSRASSLAFTVFALLAILLCVRLGFWQFDRYQFRHELTREISAALVKPPLNLDSSNQDRATAWMKISITGSYDERYQQLFRGHYFQEQYGLEVLSLFIPSDADVPPIWVDRGWLAAGKSADAATKIPPPPKGVISLSGILRQYDDPSASRGLFFALPAPRIGRIDEISLQKSFSGETFHKYLKVQAPSSDSALAISPLTPPGEGPHLAYAIQWWLFALLIAGTRIALLKSERIAKSHPEN